MGAVETLFIIIIIWYFAPHFSIVYDVTDVDCWAENGSRSFTTFKNNCLTNEHDWKSSEKHIIYFWNSIHVDRAHDVKFDLPLTFLCSYIILHQFVYGL